MPRKITTKRGRTVANLGLERLTKGGGSRLLPTSTGGRFGSRKRERLARKHKN